jgi:hypothetical protein
MSKSTLRSQLSAYTALALLAGVEVQYVPNPTVVARAKRRADRERRAAEAVAAREAREEREFYAAQ